MAAPPVRLRERMRQIAFGFDPRETVSRTLLVRALLVLLFRGLVFTPAGLFCIGVGGVFCRRGETGFTDAMAFFFCDMPPLLGPDEEVGVRARRLRFAAGTTGTISPSLAPRRVGCEAQKVFTS